MECEKTVYSLQDSWKLSVTDCDCAILE